MLKNHLKLAWRNLNRNRGYAVVNVLGLSLGIASGVIIVTTSIAAMTILYRALRAALANPVKSLRTE